MTFRTALTLTILIELAELAFTLLRAKRSFWHSPPSLPWAILAAVITFASALFLALLALQATEDFLSQSALALTVMSISSAQFGFALYYMRPRSNALSNLRMQRAWKQLASLSYVSFIAGFLLLVTWADFLVE